MYHMGNYLPTPRDIIYNDILSIHDVSEFMKGKRAVYFNNYKDKYLHEMIDIDKVNFSEYPGCIIAKYTSSVLENNRYPIVVSFSQRGELSREHYNALRSVNIMFLDPDDDAMDFINKTKIKYHKSIALNYLHFVHHDVTYYPLELLIKRYNRLCKLLNIDDEINMINVNDMQKNLESLRVVLTDEELNIGNDFDKMTWFIEKIRRELEGKTVVNYGLTDEAFDGKYISLINPDVSLNSIENNIMWVDCDGNGARITFGFDLRTIQWLDDPIRFYMSNLISHPDNTLKSVRVFRKGEFDEFCKMIDKDKYDMLLKEVIDDITDAYEEIGSHYKSIFESIDKLNSDHGYYINYTDVKNDHGRLRAMLDEPHVFAVYHEHM